MKKLIAILAVCAFVSVSSAAIVFQSDATWNPVNSRYEVNPGDIITFTVVADADTAALSINALAMSGQVSFSDNATAAGLDIGRLNGTAAAANTGNVILTSIGGSANVALSAGTALFTIKAVAGDLGSVIVIDDYVGSRTAIGLATGPNFSTRWNGAATTLDSYSVTVVPEPMTMALLGLGGLFIRRRRA